MMALMKKICLLISLVALFCLNILLTSLSAVVGGIIFFIIAAIILFKIGFFSNEGISFQSGPVIIATIICSMMGCNFHSVWGNEEIFPTLANTALLGIGTAAKLISVICVIAAIPITSVFVAKLIESWKNIFSKHETLSDYKGWTLNFKWACILLFLIFSIGISAILRSNVNYIDDIGRTIDGYKGWNNFSRYFSNSLATILYTSNLLSDTSPLMQIIAAAVLAICGIILLTIIFERKQFTIWEVVSVIPLGLNPYFLECFSYKYDAPYMAISILASIIPLVFRTSSWPMYIAVSAIGTLVTCTSYQASSGIFPMLVVLIAFRMWMKKVSLKQIGTFLINSVLGYCAGLIFFFVSVMHPADTYVSATIPSLSSLIPNYISNLNRYFVHIRSDFTTLWIWIIILLIIAFLLSTIAYTEQHKGVTVILGAVSLVFLSMLCFGLYPALTTPLFDTRAMYGFGVMLAMLCVCSVQHHQNTYIKLPALVLSWIFFVFSFTYGNALYYQHEYEDFRRELLIEDLNDMEMLATGTPVTVQINGTVGRAPALHSISNKYPIIKRLVPIMFQGEWIWGSWEFYRYYGLENIVQDTTIDLTTYDLPIVKDSMYHTIYGNDQYILIILK